MFRCENKHCGKVVPARTPANMVTIETREKTYENPVFNHGKPTNKTCITTGFETVREIKVCPNCFRELTGEQPQEAPFQIQSRKLPVRHENKFEDSRPKQRKHWRNPKSGKRNKDNNQHKKPVVEVINPLTQ